MDENSIRLVGSKSSTLHHLYRRLCHQGVAQWITLFLIISCIGLFMVSTPSSSYVYRRGQYAGRAKIPLDDGANNENGIDGAVEKKSDNVDDINDEKPPFFSGTGFWDGVDWQEPMEVPERFTNKLPYLAIENGQEDVEVTVQDEIMHVFTTYFQESVPKGLSKGDVLLLHSPPHDSDTWARVGTLKIIAAMGYRATAINLPGFGQSIGSVLLGYRAVSFLENFMQAHSIQNPIIIAPGIAGGYAFPFLMSRPHKLKALIAISPTTFHKYTQEDYKKIKVPLLMLYSSSGDLTGEGAKKVLQNCTSAYLKVIPGMQHSLYDDQPDEFHRLLYVMLNRLEAYNAKLAKENFITTEHPPVVTLNSAETFPPDVTMEPLPRRRVTLPNGEFDPEGGYEPLSPNEINGTWAGLFEQMLINQNNLTNINSMPNKGIAIQTMPLTNLDSLPPIQHLLQPNPVVIPKQIPPSYQSNTHFGNAESTAVESNMGNEQINNETVISSRAKSPDQQFDMTSMQNTPNISPEMVRQQQFMSGYPDGMDEQAFLKAQREAAMKSVGEPLIDVTPAPYFVQRPGSTGGSSKQSNENNKDGLQMTQFAQQPQILPSVPPHLKTNQA